MDKVRKILSHKTFLVSLYVLFAALPDWLGLNLWNLLNALVLLAAVYYLLRLSQLQKGWVLLIVLLELMGSLMNEQSNALIAGLLIFAFGLPENKKGWLASLCVVLWFVREKKSALNITLFLSALLFTSLAYTDIVPSSVRHAVFLPYAFKALPCILIWMKIIYDMMVLTPKPDK